MATITYNINNADLSDVIDALAEHHGYTNEPNKTTFVKEQERDRIKSITKAYRQRQSLISNPPAGDNPNVTVE